MFTGITRLPMVAGWDGLLPAWFMRLHPRFRTPQNSVVFIAGTTLAFSILGLLGVGKQEAFQLLWNASGIFYGLTYLVMFAIPIAGSVRAPVWLKIASLSGFVMTLGYVVLSILPIIQVGSRLPLAPPDLAQHFQCFGRLCTHIGHPSARRDYSTLTLVQEGSRVGIK